MLSTIILAVIAIFIPPFAVVVRRGCGADLLINILLTFLCWIPGVAHAYYILARYPSKRHRHVERRYSHSRSQKGSRHTRSRSRSRSTARPRSRSYERVYHSGHVRPAPPQPAPPTGTYQKSGYSANYNPQAPQFPPYIHTW